MAQIEDKTVMSADSLEDFEIAYYLLKNGTRFDLPDAVVEEYKDEIEGMSYERAKLYIAVHEIAKIKAAQLSVLFDE